MFVFVWQGLSPKIKLNVKFLVIRDGQETLPHIQGLDVGESISLKGCFGPKRAARRGYKHCTGMRMISFEMTNTRQ